MHLCAFFIREEQERARPHRSRMLAAKAAPTQNPNFINVGQITPALNVIQDICKIQERIILF